MKEKGERLFYHHEYPDPLYEDRTVMVGGHADPEIALIAHKGNDAAIYIPRSEVESVIVALAVGTSYVTRSRPDRVSKNYRPNAMSGFVESFREAMVPTFRDRMRAAIDAAEDDWAAKCAVTNIVNEYERLR
ncbi:hypothetical protein [Brevibacterium oceani]|uniref:hypothetical protein n=1 Tax=Brevibacterium oceani TaxID=358099 RepID=UPI0015E7C0D9|nr:hypothetical protein [Brevibacterium oceani]